MSKPEYLPSDTFQGPKQGYIFTTRDNKIGYYIDVIGGVEIPGSPGKNASSPRRTNMLQRMLDSNKKNVVLWLGCAAAALIILYLVYRWRQRC